MEFSIFQIYLVSINIISILTYFFGFLIKKMDDVFDDENSKINMIYIVLSILGGSIGIFLGWIAIDRRKNKAYAAFLLFSLCSFMIWTCVFFSIYGPVAEVVQNNVTDFLFRKSMLIIYLLIINISTIVVFKIDKNNSIEDATRIPVYVLLLLCIFGGAVGGLIGMYHYKHKNKKYYFKYGIPAIIVSEFLVLFFLEMAEIL